MENPEVNQKRKGTIACKECCIVSEPKYQYEKDKVSGDFIYSWGSITLCDECMAQDWIFDPKEMVDVLNKDTLFTVGIESPFKEL